MRQSAHPDNQRGMVLIMLLLMVALAVTALILNALDANALKIEQDRKTAAALAEARSALVGRAVMDANHPGSLPCPDGNDDGASDPFSGSHCSAYIGRFPWKTLGTGDLRDGSGERLWYALSSNYRDHTSAEPINGSAAGSLNLDGMGDKIAVVFAPGLPLSAQTGRPGNTLTDYLESENADGDLGFSRLLSATQNDRLISVDRADLLPALALRVLGEIKGDSTQGMVRYYNTAGGYPYADTDGDGHADIGQYTGRASWQSGSDSLFFNSATRTMLLDNHWISTVSYTIASDRQSATLSVHGKSLAIAP